MRQHNKSTKLRLQAHDISLEKLRIPITCPWDSHARHTGNRKTTVTGVLKKSTHKPQQFTPEVQNGGSKMEVCLESDAEVTMLYLSSSVNKCKKLATAITIFITKLRIS